MSSLKEKVAKGTVWVVAATIVSRMLQLVSAAVLTRMLDPSTFGLMAVALAVMAFAQRATMTGFDSAIIQKQDQPEKYLDTAWTCELIRNLALFAVIFLAAPLLARFFHDKRATLVIQVTSISYLFMGMRNIGIVFFRKELNFSKQFVYEVVPIIVRLGIVLPLAFAMRSVWALVWANVGASIAMCVVSYVLHPYRPHLDLNLARAKSLFSFGIWIFGSSILAMLREQGIVFFLGRVLGVTALGIFNRAEAFSMLIFRQIIVTIWRVGYPVLSQIQSDKVRFRKVFFLGTCGVALLGFPLAGGFLLMSHDFVFLVLTPRWQSLAPLIQIFSLQALLMFVNALPGIAFQALGKPGIGTRIAFVSVVVMVVLVYPLSVRWGLRGAAVASLAGMVVTTPITWIRVIALLEAKTQEVVSLFTIISFNTALMMLAIYLAQVYFTKAGILWFSLQIALGSVVYVLASLISARYCHAPLVRIAVDFSKGVIRQVPAQKVLS